MEVIGGVACYSPEDGEIQARCRQTGQVWKVRIVSGGGPIYHYHTVLVLTTPCPECGEVHSKYPGQTTEQTCYDVEVISVEHEVMIDG